jgi:autotransporter-associated beta strand protein
MKRRAGRSYARLRIAALLACVSLSAIEARAGSATWNLNGTGDYNTATNWTPNTVPNTAADTATFATSNQISASFSANTTVGGWTFNAGASNYAFTNAFVLTFSGAGIVINGGSASITTNNTLSFVNSSTAGSATITNNAGSLLQFLDSSTAGSATITNNAGSLLRFLDSSTAGSATITNTFFGLLQFNNSSTAGSATITNALGGVVDFSASAGPANNNQLSAGSLAGAGNFYLGANQLTVGGNNLSTTVSGVISDCGAGGVACNAAGATGGSLVKVGSGTLTLSGANTYTGATTVNGGTLEVDGSILNSSSVTVNAGGTLSGTGIVDPPTTTIGPGGTLAPGNAANPTETLTITGSLAFQSGAIYLVQINPSAAGLTNVIGTASLAGTVQAVFAPGSYTMRSYDILHAAGGLGGTTFSGLSGNVPANFTASLSYTATDVFLNLTANLAGLTAFANAAAGPGALGCFTVNQCNVAAAINAFFNNGGALPPNFAALFNLTGANLANALTLLSGEPATGAQQPAFQLMTEFMGLMLDPFVDGRAGIGGAYGQASAFAPDREPLPEDIALAYSKVLRTPVSKAALYEPRWSVWGAGYGGYNRTSGDPAVIGSHDLTARTAGGAAGMDYRIAPGTVVGFALAGGGTGWSLAQGLGSGSGDAFQAGAYAKTQSGPFYLAGALAYTQHWMSTDRFAAFGDRLYASFNAESFGGRAEAGWRIPGVLGAITPYAAVQAQNFHTPSYNETDITGGGFGLTYAARNADDTRSELGARYDKPVLLNYGTILAWRAKVAWAHDWISDPSLVPGFEALPGTNFTVNGATPAKNSALTSAGAELRLINGVSVLAKFDGEFATHSQTYAGTGTVRYTW